MFENVDGLTPGSLFGSGEPINVACQRFSQIEGNISKPFVVGKPLNKYFCKK